MSLFRLNQILSNRPLKGGNLVLGTLAGTKTMSLAEVFDRSSAVAGYLTELGLRPGDTIGILAGNCLEWVLLDLAALRLKIKTAGFDPGKFRLEDDIATRYDLKFLFTDKFINDPNRRVIALSTLIADCALHCRDIQAPVYTLHETTTIKFTSGSTGVPKGLAATVGSIESSISAVQEIFQHGPSDNLFVFLPLSLLQQRYWIYSALAFGHDVTLSTYQAAFLTVAQVKPTVVMGVPAFFETARRHIESKADSNNLSQRAVELFGPRIRYLWTGSAPADSCMLSFYWGIGLPIYEGYGMNETCIVTKNHPGAYREGSVGRAVTGKRVSIEPDGSVTVYSDFPVNNAYFHAPAGVSEKLFIAPGQIRTGDLGYLDEDGFLFISGRQDDVIVLDNGKKIDVHPIESRFREAPWVAECVVFCVAQSDLVAVLSLSLSRGEVFNIEELHQRVNAQGQRDERISSVIVADEAFSIENGLLTSQYKPIRSAIAQRYYTHASNIEAPHHAERP